MAIIALKVPSHKANERGCRHPESKNRSTVKARFRHPSYSATVLAPLIEQLDGARVPWLPGYRVKIIDGNGLEASDRRLKALREVQGGAVPGKSLVVYEPAQGLVTDGFPCEDGHAQERSLFGTVLETVQADDLWIQDRK